MTTPFIGSHLSCRGGNISYCYNKAQQYGMDTFQFFMGGRGQNSYEGFKKEEIIKVKRYCEILPIYSVCHASYSTNLTVLKEDVDTCIYKKKETDVVNGILSRLNEMEKLTECNEHACGRKGGVVVHFGTCFNHKHGLRRSVQTVNKILAKTGNTNLIAENHAGNKIGTAIGTTLQDLQYIQQHCKYPDKLKFCIDTCHIFSAGQYDLGDIQEVDRFFSDFDSMLGMDSLEVFHLNDSKTIFGGKLDRHQQLGQGHIWTGKMRALRQFLDKTKMYGIPCVSETGQGNRDCNLCRFVCAVSYE